jgi:signal peptidase I
MAPGLLGEHVTVTCVACGWEYDVGAPRSTLCPNCHLRTAVEPGSLPLKDGDRILVHKWPTVIGGPLRPQRWDVVVFRNPAEPEENYIKRVVGLPGETVEIVDGDVFINGRVVRKTRAAQSVLWLPVWDQWFVPDPQARAVAGSRWHAPQTGGDTSGWQQLEQRELRYAGLDDRLRVLHFAPGDIRYFQDVYAYDEGPSVERTPFVNDMRMVAEIVFEAGDGFFRMELERDGWVFIATIARDGQAALTMRSPASGLKEVTVGTADVGPLSTERPVLVEIGHLDYRAYLRVGGRLIAETDERIYGPDLGELRKFERREPLALRLGARDVVLRLPALRIERDVYYTYRPGQTRRGYAGHLFVLNNNEYFVLGDNSPGSKDSREWVVHGPHLPPAYRLGTVPLDQIVGEAAFVYLPGLLPMDALIPWLPDIGRMRFIR